MIFYYRKSGVVADVAVLFNLMLQMAILATFSATMTLPGIAGLALTIGMSVDANVLINERIREELRAGKSVRAAVEAGYASAFRRSSTGTSPSSSRGSSCAVRQRAREGLRGHAHRRHRLQPLHGRVLHAPRLRLVGARREGQTPQRRRRSSRTMEFFKPGRAVRLHGAAVVLDPAESIILVVISTFLTSTRAPTTARTSAAAPRSRSRSTSRSTRPACARRSKRAGFSTPDVVQVVGREEPEPLPHSRPGRQRRRPTSKKLKTPPSA
jgi:hypothetical protein